MSEISWKGVFAVLVTPFNEDQTLDLASLVRQVEFCLACEVDGLVAPIMASEFFTLSDEERLSIMQTVAEVNGKQVPFVAGVAGVSQTHAATLSEAAVKSGADAVVAMPPYTSQFVPLDRLIPYYQAIAEASGLPVIVQNAPEPVGSPLDLAQLLQLIERVPSIVCIKEETFPNPQKVAALVQAAPAGIQGIFGGLGGIYLFNELSRGATGTMPACQFADVMVRIFCLLESDQPQEARRVFHTLMPALVMERLYTTAFMKTVLQRRGVIHHATTRTVSPSLDDCDLKELDTIWQNLEPYFTTAHSHIQNAAVTL